MTNQEFQELVEINKKLGGKYENIVQQLAIDLGFNKKNFESVKGESNFNEEEAVADGLMDTPYCNTAFVNLRTKCLQRPYSLAFGNFNSITSFKDAESKLISKEDIESSLNVIQLAEVRQTIITLYRTTYDCYDTYTGDQKIRQCQIQYVKKTIDRLKKIAPKSGGLSEEETAIFNAINFSTNEAKNREDLKKVLTDGKALFNLLPKVFQDMKKLSEIEEALRHVSIADANATINLIKTDFWADTCNDFDKLKKHAADLEVKYPYMKTLVRLFNAGHLIKKVVPEGKKCTQEVYDALDILSEEIKEIDKLELGCNKMVKNEEYKEARANCDTVITALKNFETSFSKSINKNQILPGCSEEYERMKSYYEGINLKIANLENLKETTAQMHVVTLTREAYDAFLDGPKFRFSTDCPSSDDKTVVENLIQAYKDVQKFFNENLGVQERTVFVGIVIADKIQYLEDLIKKAEEFEKVRQDWASRLSADEEGRQILEPKNVVDPSNLGRDETVLDASEDLFAPVAAEGDGDGDNLTHYSDVTQGDSGNCYFLASVASIATEPNFFYKDDNTGVIRVVELPNGKVDYFLVKVYLPLIDNSDERTEVLVKVSPDFIKNGDNKLKYAKGGDFGGPFREWNVGAELWVAILEKAFAEVKGSYADLDAGRPEEAFALLMNKTSDDVKTVNLGMPKSIEVLDETEHDNDTKLEHYITGILANNGKITIHTKKESDLTSLTGAVLNQGNVVFGSVIIVPGHAYTVLSITGTTVRMRNPHGADSHAGEFLEMEIVDLATYFDDMLFVH